MSKFLNLVSSRFSNGYNTKRYNFGSEFYSDTSRYLKPEFYSRFISSDLNLFLRSYKFKLDCEYKKSSSRNLNL